MQIKPFIVGSGMSGQAIAKALAIIDIVDPEISVEPPVRLARDQPLAGLAAGHDLPLLCIGNPHGLHARYVLEAQRAGFRAIVVDKPPCVNRDELAELRALASAHGDRLQVAVLHGYRQMWGPQRMRQMIAAGELGELIAIEGTYWQSSAAELAVLDPPPTDKSWKSDPVLGGPYDTYVDLASHWVDLVLFLAGERPQAARRWLSFVNAPAPNRDTFVQIYLQFAGCRSFGSASKTVHGANDLQLSAIGSERAVRWVYGVPDQLEVGRGNQVTCVRRGPGRYGSQQPLFHGMGWIEGYLEVIHCFLQRLAGRDAPAPPSLDEALDVMEVLLTASDL